MTKRDNLVEQNLDDGEYGEGDDGTASDQVTQHLMNSTSTKKTTHKKKLPPKPQNSLENQQKCHINNKVSTKNSKIATKNE